MNARAVRHSRPPPYKTPVSRMRFLKCFVGRMSFISVRLDDVDAVLDGETCRTRSASRRPSSAVMGDSSPLPVAKTPPKASVEANETLASLADTPCPPRAVLVHAFYSSPRCSVWRRQHLFGTSGTSPHQAAVAWQVCGRGDLQLQPAGSPAPPSTITRNRRVVTKRHARAKQINGLRGKHGLL